LHRILFTNTSSHYMRLISFDVGIKNLAYCVFSIPSSTSQSNPNHASWCIPEWNCANLIAQEPVEIKPCCQPIKGKRKTDDEHPCNKMSKWIVPGDAKKTYCEMHAKMHSESWIIPKRKHTTSHVNKLKLLELETEYKSLFPSDSEIPTKKQKKSELSERIIRHYESKCFRSVDENVEKQKTAGEIDLVTIGRAIRRQLDEDPATESVTHVIIENQISTIAARMKTIQGMIAQYFIMRFGDRVHIEFVSSHNKLKGFAETTQPSKKTGEDETKAEVGGSKEKKTKTSYKANKTDGIAICRRFIEANQEMRGWMIVFEKSKKRDDLADCFLQGVWYLKSNNIIHYADNLKINSVIVS
jgi:hypothetical protein